MVGEYPVRQGENGIQLVTYDCVYIDGELVSRIPRENETVVLKEPVDALIEVGTYVQTYELSEYNEAYSWPVPGLNGVSRGFVPGGHRGLDITAAYNTPIYAANQGVVIISGVHWSWGNYCVIEHPDGMTTLYAHCSSVAVAQGDIVMQNQIVGYVGSTGVSTGNHLHFEVTSGGALVDPYLFVSRP